MALTKTQALRLASLIKRMAVLAKYDAVKVIKINIKLPTDIDLEKSDYHTPTHVGAIHPNKPYIAVKHPEGQIMWHSNADAAGKTDSIINDPKLRQNILGKISNPTHRGGINAIMDMVAKDPNRHFIPSRDGGKEKMRARHIKNLLLSPESVKMDLSPDNTLSISMARHGTLGGSTTWRYNLQPKGMAKNEQNESERSEQGRDFEINERILSGRDLREYARSGRNLEKSRNKTDGSRISDRDDRNLSKNSDKDNIPGGLADKKSPEDFDQEQLAAGIQVELEHTSDSNIAREIAMDHLTEDPNYYKKLKTIEKSEQPQFKRGDVVHLSHGVTDLERGGTKVDRTKKYVVHGTGTSYGRTAHWVVPMGEKDSRKGFYHRRDRLHPAED
jgi:hypothetical protein